MALADPPPVDRADAADWIEAQLERLPEGASTVLYHSYVWLYLPPQTKARIIAALERAGGRLPPKTGLAWLSFESGTGTETPVLSLTLWPGGERRVLAEAHPHGRWVRWLAD